MYKILLVTDRPEILDAFQAVSSWESLGFRVPRICNSAEGAIACLKAHHVDGIGIRLDLDDIFVNICCLTPVVRVLLKNDFRIRCIACHDVHT